MNIQQIKRSLPILMKHDIVPFLWGVQGVGKTAVTEQVGIEMGAPVIHLNLATQEVGDIVGLLKHNEDGTVSHARPAWMPPYYLDKECTVVNKKRYILFLDEYNRAHPDVQQSSFTLLLDKRIHTHKCPVNMHIVAAGNYASGEFTTTDMSDKALMSRFCHIDFEPTVAEFVAYADLKGAATVAGFISENESCLESGKRERVDHNVTPDRRAWMKMIAALEMEDINDKDRFELYSGIVGKVAASTFVQWKNTAERKIRLSDILNDYPKHREKVRKMGKGKKEARFDTLSTPIEELVTKLAIQENRNMMNDAQVENLKQFFLDIPRELVLSTVKKLAEIPAFSGRDAIMNDKAFSEALFG